MRCSRKTLKADSFAALDVATAIGAVTCAVANLIVAKATGAAIGAAASVVVATPTGAATAATDAAPDAHAATAVMSVDVDILMSLVLVLLLLLLLLLLRLNHVSHFGHGIEELRLSRVIRNHCGKLYPHPRASAILAVGRAAFGKGRVGCACDFGAHAWTGAALETVAAAANAITSGAWATTDTVQILEKQVRDYPCSHLLREVCMNGFAFDTLPLDLCLSPVDEFFD